MDKQQEIKALQSLKGNSYFGEYFADADIEQMCQNIKNDFPIEFNTKLEAMMTGWRNAGAKVEELETELKLTQMALEAKAESYNRLFETLNETAKWLIENSFFDKAKELVGEREVVMIKLNNGYPLNEDDFKYIRFNLG